MPTLPDRKPATKLSPSPQLFTPNHVAAHFAAQRKAGYIPENNGIDGKASGSNTASASYSDINNFTITSSISTKGSTFFNESHKKSTPPATHPSSHGTNSTSLVNDYLWNLDLENVKLWIRHALFPNDSVLENDGQKNDFSMEIDIAESLLENIIKSLQSASQDPYPTSSSIVKRDSKRVKLNTSTDNVSTPNSFKDGERDLYNILDTSFSTGKEACTYLPGALLSRLTKAGILNALSGKVGGIVDPNTGEVLNGSDRNYTDEKCKNHRDDEPVITAKNLTMSQIESKYVSNLKLSIDARLELDTLKSTPSRIVEILCPNVTMSDILCIRRRIYDTVVLGRGTNSSSLIADSAGNFPVAARTAIHDIDKFKKCHVCGNNDQSSFVLDKKNGDLICTNCGTVATESLMHEGSQFRKFEGEIDRNHHGDVANPLYSNAHNMGTTLGGVSWKSGAGLGGYGSSRGTRGLENILRNAHAYTEMNISQFGKEEKKTRIGYKDKQKKDAFARMNHVGDTLSLHPCVIQRAKELFSGFRDDRELVVQFKGVVAGCLCEAFDQFCKDGRQILKVKTGEEFIGNDFNVVHTTNTRASKRSELHSSSLAGKGGLMLNLETRKVTRTDKTTLKSDDAQISAAERKDVSSWDLDDARSFLLEASRKIARYWHDNRDKDEGINIPDGGVQELEGFLVTKTLLLCAVLEHELNKTKSKGKISRQRVGTPRLKDMGNLGIKWQHKSERGSGGAGGVGNSGRVLNISCKRTAGQILKIKNSIKLSEAVDDRVVGDAFYRELRALLTRQEARKKHDNRNESSLQRLNQANRKQYLVARTHV